ncbi:SAM-dependent methyltransferase [Brevibacterium epidermidis]|jgi:SAM-dependent methyltransferase|uniref:SAM-dependent methyltransferase n=1 Tax=Brevibacterium epidermidis TaxID=1698 RepID=A0ABV4EKB1_BREEP
MDVGAYDDELLAAIYDDDNPDGADHDYFRSVADEISAASITDLGCGTGILTVTLAGPGRIVAGIDPAAAMLARAESRPGGDCVEWRLGTSELIDRDANDLIVMSGNVAMHIIDEAWRATLLDIAQGLKAGGRLVFETRNPRNESWTAWGGPAEVRETSAGTLRESESVSGPDADGTVTMTTSHEFIGAGRTIETTPRLRFRSAETLQRDLHSVGLRIENLWSDWHRSPFTGSAEERLIVVEASKGFD